MVPFSFLFSFHSLPFHFFLCHIGSITNFPFVPTIKFVTTSKRFVSLENDMDVNAGLAMEKGEHKMVHDVYRLTCEVASGLRTKGELSSHSQVSFSSFPQPFFYFLIYFSFCFSFLIFFLKVSIWRNWRHHQPPDPSSFSVFFFLTFLLLFITLNSSSLSLF